MRSRISTALRCAGAAVVCGGLLAVSGCVGTGPSEGGAVLPAGPASADPGRLHPLFPQQRLRSAPLLDEADTRGLESTPWQLASTAGDSLTIRYVAGGGCSAFEGVRVTETRTHVEVWTTVRTDRGAQACAADLLIGASRVHLAAPVGTRRILHAPVSEHWRTYIDDF